MMPGWLRDSRQVIDHYHAVPRGAVKERVKWIQEQGHAALVTPARQNTTGQAGTVEDPRPLDGPREPAFRQFAEAPVPGCLRLGILGRNAVEQSGAVDAKAALGQSPGKRGAQFVDRGSVNENRTQLTMNARTPSWHLRSIHDRGEPAKGQ